MGSAFLPPSLSERKIRDLSEGGFYFLTVLSTNSLNKNSILVHHEQRYIDEFQDEARKMG